MTVPSPMKQLSRIVVLAALACSVAGARGQDPQQPGPTFRTKVDLVRVDVSVSGRDDEVVADLQPSDFEVQEDGIPVKVETLQFVRLDGSRTSNTDESLQIRSAEHAALEAAREDVRLFAIFLDDYHVDKSPSITAMSRKALKDLVEKFGPNDLVTVVDPLTPLSHVKFTRSREELLARMEAFEGRRGQTFPVRSVMEEAQLRERNVWELRGGVSLSALGAIVTHLGGLREGRKSVVFFSQGPPLGRLGGPNEERLRDVLQAANRGNVTIHVIDPRPLGGGAPLGGTDALFRLYNETGGRAIINSNNPSQRLDGIISDASAYYLLGYTPARAFADGRFHRIDVTVKRRGVRVTARRGYWAPTEKETTAAPAAPAEPGLADALAQLADPKAARPVDVWIGLSRGDGEQTRVSVTWEQGSTRDARQRASRLAVERLLSRSSTSAEERHVIGPTANGADSAVATFEVAGGNELFLRLTAETADGVIVDQWDQALRVPEFDVGALGLSTPRFLRARSAFEAQAMRAGQDPPPAASRQFRPTDRVMVEVECYAPVDAATTLSAQLLNGKGERLTDLTIPAPVEGRSRFVLPLSSLAPSTYVLRLDARAGDRDVQQRTAFRVVP